MIPPAPNVEYSAKVQIWLEVDGLCLSVSQVGESSLILSESAASMHIDMPLLANLVTFVDGEEVAFSIAVRKRLGRLVFFEHCEARTDDPEIASLPF